MANLYGRRSGSRDSSGAVLELALRVGGCLARGDRLPGFLDTRALLFPNWGGSSNGGNGVARLLDVGINGCREGTCEGNEGVRSRRGMKCFVLT